MSLQIVHWYVVDGDGMTIVGSGTIQEDHINTVKVWPGQKLRKGDVNPLTMYEKDGVLCRYSPGQLQKRAKCPGPGFIWRAASMDWEDRRPFNKVVEDKIHSLHKEHGERKTAPVEVDGKVFHTDAHSLHRASYAGKIEHSENDLRWRDADGVMHTWDTPEEYQTFMEAWGAAVAKHLASVDRWKDDLYDQILAAKSISELDAIIW